MRRKPSIANHCQEKCYGTESSETTELTTVTQLKTGLECLRNMCTTNDKMPELSFHLSQK